MQGGRRQEAGGRSRPVAAQLEKYPQGHPVFFCLLPSCLLSPDLSSKELEWLT